MMPTKRVSMMKLALRKGDALALAQPRAKAVNSENIRKYYCLLDQYYFRGAKKLTSSGWDTCVVCGGKQRTTTPSVAAKQIVSGS